ncbi:MAG: hypothetical protein OER91_08110 [Gammaproteobacteria bacterium]|nr:hypothetical protein [Gammaproteobacteria bacterium]
MNKTLKPNYAKDRAATRTLLPIVALGGGLAVAPAAALELGELTVQSNLGQPLRASIAYALAPNEMLGDTCVSVGGGRSTGDLPGIGRNTVTITDSAILITGESLIREPMMATRVTINCPYTPNLSREYMLFVDPAGVTETRVATVAPAATPVVESATRMVARTTRATRSVDTTPIGQATRYQTRVGDTLSDIVSRIENRSMSLWPAVNTIFAANPDAFIDNDPNKLKAGAWLTIPSLDGTAPVVSAAVPAAAPAVEAATVPPVQMVDGAVYEPPILEDTAEPVVDEAPAGETAVADETVEAGTGTVVESGNPFVEPGTTITIPDTELAGPTTTSESPNVPTAIISTGSRSESTSMLAWFIGGGLAIFGLLVLFGRRIRDRFGSTPVAAAAVGASMYEEDSEDYDIEDDSPTEENLALDADLVLGTGLTDGTEMDVAQDFGFASPTDVDIELPFEPQPADDISEGLPPPRDKSGSILESEILPEDDDYDMSVILDATQAPQFGSDMSPTDQYAIDPDVSPTDEYTINEDVADILEQDYEEELTATQALNKEIERAAAELADTFDEVSSEEETSEMPLADVSELDETSEMPLTDASELDETAHLPLSDDDTVETVSEPQLDETAAVTVNMSSDESTAEMPVANDDETTEMEISGGKVDTKNR